MFCLFGNAVVGSCIIRPSSEIILSLQSLHDESECNSAAPSITFTLFDGDIGIETTLHNTTS